MGCLETLLPRIYFHEGLRSLLRKDSSKWMSWNSEVWPNNQVLNWQGRNSFKCSMSWQFLARPDVVPSRGGTTPKEPAVPRRSSGSAQWIDSLWELIRLVQTYMLNYQLGAVVLGWQWELCGHHMCIPWRLKSRETWVIYTFDSSCVFYLLFSHSHGDQISASPTYKSPDGSSPPCFMTWS